jgi:Lar family restriction alleviation protein
MSEYLKSCPFCGGSAAVENGPAHIWYVQCKGCGTDGRIGKTEQDAIDAWNRREPSSVFTVQSSRQPRDDDMGMTAIEIRAILKRLDAVDDLVSHASVYVPDVDIYNKGSKAFWEVVNTLQKACHSLELRAVLETPPEQSRVDEARWQMRYETLRALYPSAPSEKEIDIALDAALSRSALGREES